MKILDLIKKHFSFLIILSSSVCLFIISIGLKEYLSPTDYSKFAMILTFITLSYSYGLIGLDKVILRLSTYENNQFHINKQLITSVIPIIVVTTPVLVYLVYFYTNISLIYSLSIILMPTFFIFIYNIYRLKHDFNFSQIILNGWKILLFAYLIYYFLFQNINNIGLDEILISTSFIFLILTFISFLKLKKENFKLYKKDEDCYKYLFQYFVSLSILSVMGFGDRFLIEHFVSFEDVGKFFFYMTIVSYPFSLFQTYIGFKKVPEFKKNFNAKIFKKEIKNTLILSIVPFITVIIMVAILNNIDFFKNLKIDNYYLVLILILLGLSKMISGVLSAAMNVVSEPEDIKKINRYTILSLFSFLILFFINDVNLNIIALIFVFIWMTRNYLYYKFINQRLNYENQ